ncbi:MAG TPA: hypothetical protein VGQ55_02560, partial [Pyrinomonadaceae bacterium]|nr:hypothetical protein [Pyrinomonadaceae bacterium]
MDPVTKERRKEPDVLEKPERKAAARDVSTLLTGTSEPTRRNIGKDAIVSFFQSLNPDRRQLADDQDLMWIGKTLYEFRPLEKDDKPPEMTEQEKRLIKLACRLLEDAFYDGRLANMYERDAASVAFIVNTIAKIFDVREYRNELKDTFEAKKFRFFTYDVERFEAQALFPDTDGEKGR